MMLAEFEEDAQLNRAGGGMTGASVTVTNVSKNFWVSVNRMHQQVRALQDVTIDIPAGEITAITGISGCGKTTLLRIIVGLERASSGSVKVAGREINGPGYDRGMVFQHAELLPWRNALANVEFGLEVKGVPAKERRATAEYYLEFVGLKDAMQRRPDQLSGGMKQRVGLARALAIEPSVLLMDEPFGALDAQTREVLQGELLRIHQSTGRTIIIVTHDIDEAVVLADRVVILAPSPGRVETILDINIPRPRQSPVEIRTTSEFVEKRHRLWELLQATQPGSIEDGADFDQGD
ncbi:ABC transporter ATP-binding protein [Aurantimonas sp. C2-6-R+9]|uniref:ABC transporter ATP-binding protein n=1 Tax=unclassified Aurantimonas TaxID=2638230 RepID=UPI002E16DA32|nr:MULTISPECIES: ABC transporter ATP-binding protein [unclassified Aurantimonas]MEC5293125.1 ABC transporter ATP-binding protein [Aurantimonas sp. C2-3-R2]MEC5383223.1 ABC transporter ATP-binding protein [Aurantimonas sp. C2-6-R+9]MEC5414207.1 ABC transporter ATP-binding protein [Aurantimonas sp. C2-4-R8]